MSNHKLIFKDQMGRDVEINFPPRRIISLVPSITELLIDLGAEVVGRTKFCIHPKDKVSPIPIVGGTKNFRFEVIDDLKPDLIVGNKEENYQAGITMLSERYPVWMSDITELNDALEMIRMLSEVTDRKEEGALIRARLLAQLDGLQNSKSGSVLYLIWKKPWMAAGRDTYVHHFLEHLGYDNVVSASRYPELSESEIADRSPDRILLSSEPFPFQEGDQKALQSIFPDSLIELVDGEAYSWYGSRLLKVDL
ncbi:helical backbone metal receptor [Marinoscillum sp.]|uniref:helical backbone metal receptor n=1 Tax=Marinoscillum sp. TaxID=2024838 RepID=UPI003BA98A57